MKNAIKSNKILSQIGFGFTGAAFTGALSLCVCAVTNRGLLSFLLCCILCFAFSVKSKESIFAPHSFLLVPLFFAMSQGSELATGLTIFGGGLIYLLMSKLMKSRRLPDFVISGAGLGLAVGATILLTNSYFGIGANSFTPFDMLKEFRSLGFHPNFRGLFYGTITLFAMITFPFKFKKLNKYLPAAFVTLLIPYAFNLFLNPQRELTTINEALSLALRESLRAEFTSYMSISAKDIPLILKGSVGFGVILYIFGNDGISVAPANCLSGILSGIPVKKHPIKSYGVISAVTSAVIITLWVFLCPSAFSRLPLHCAGSMLIVFAWQSLPTASLKSVFKERNFIKILLMLLCAVPFVLTDVFASTLVCIIVWAIFGNRKELTK